MRNRHFGAAVFILVLTACSGDSYNPTNPQPTIPPPQQFGGIGGYIFGGADGNCLNGARVEILSGPSTGKVIVQRDCPFGDAYGYWFDGLPLGEPVTVRASAQGYKSQEKRLVAVQQVPQMNFVLQSE